MSALMDYWFRCPDCDTIGAIDEEQADGKVSIVCQCGFHATGRAERKVPTTFAVRRDEAPTMVGH